jgi:predicted GTPase
MSIARVCDAFPQLGPSLPAMGDGDAQLAELAATIRAVPCDVVITGIAIDLAAALAP